MGKVEKRRARHLLGKPKIAKDSDDEEDLQRVSSGLRDRRGDPDSSPVSAS